MSIAQPVSIRVGSHSWESRGGNECRFQCSDFPIGLYVPAVNGNPVFRIRIRWPSGSVFEIGNTDPDPWYEQQGIAALMKLGQTGRKI